MGGNRVHLRCRDDLGTAHFLVSNKHVFVGASELTVRMSQARGDPPVLGRGTQVTIVDFNDAAWTGHPNPAVDVAVMAMGPVFEEMDRRGARPFFPSVNPELYPSATQMAGLDALEQVVFVGYPSGLFDRVNLLPIARRGAAATPLAIDSNGLPAFLVDASVFPGSSGSPVFLIDRGMYADRTGGTVVGSRFLCLGVIAAVHIRQVEGRVEELPSRLAVSLDEPLDLGIVFKSSAIETRVDESCCVLAPPAQVRLKLGNRVRLRMPIEISERGWHQNRGREGKAMGQVAPHRPWGCKQVELACGSGSQSTGARK